MAAAVPTTAAALLTANVRERLNVMLQDSNGDDVYSNEKALYGFIPAAEYMVVPESFHDAKFTKVVIDGKSRDFPDIPLRTIGSAEHVKAYLGGTSAGKDYRDRTAYQYYSDELLVHKIELMNFVKLRDSTMDSANAYTCAALRARWISLGAYTVASKDDARPFSEVEVVIEDDKGTKLEKMAAATTMEELYDVDIASAIEFVAESGSLTHGSKWVVGLAESIWGAEEHVVRVRGHHYKPEYETLLRKYVSACHEGNKKIPAEINLKHLFRTSIHPFGLRALAIVSAHFAIHGKLGNAGLIRYSGAPNGMAVVTTTAACLRAMAGEPWYARFRSIYGDSIDLLEGLENMILANKYGHHMSARLYGVDLVASVSIEGKSYSVERMKEVGANMAAIAQGFIEAMNEAVKSGTISSFSFSNAKVMEKYASNNPLSTIRIRTLILYALDAIGEAKSVKAATASALPQLEAGESSVATGSG